MKLVRFKTFLVLLLIVFLGAILKVTHAQEHVFVKSISKSINVSNRSVIIDAEKANITITEAVDENFVIDLKLISKHTDKQIAEDQLIYLNHIINIKNREVYLRNYILISSGKDLTGSIHFEYNLKIPKDKFIYITNSLGNIDINNINGNFTINSKYGNITLKNIKGALELNAHIGDLIIENCDLKSSIKIKYISSYFYNSSGSFIINSDLGSLNFNLNKNISNLAITASGTEILLLNKNCDEFNLNLNSQYSNIFIDECNTPIKLLIQSDSRDSENEKKEFIYFNPKVNSSISIINKFANISIQ